MCESEFEAGILCESRRALADEFVALRSGKPAPEMRLPGRRVAVALELAEARALGVTLLSSEGNSELRPRPGALAEVLAVPGTLGTLAEASDMGGDGGS